MRNVVRELVLALVYFLVVTPAGLLRGLLVDPMRRRPDRRAHSYWTWLGEPNDAAALVRATTPVGARPAD